MRHAWRWLLWAWISAGIWASFAWAPLAQGFIGQSSRILFFHVPMAWTSFVAFMAAGVWSVAYLWRRRPEHDRAAESAVEIGLVFCVLATVTGAMWAKTMWGAFWNWDPRQTSITVVLVFYAAYLVLRGSVEDPEARARLGAVYAVLGLLVAPFFFFVLPRLAEFTLHPETVINTAGKIDMDRRMLWVLLGNSLGFTVVFFWALGVRRRLAGLEAREPQGGGLV